MKLRLLWGFLALFTVYAGFAAGVAPTNSAPAGALAGTNADTWLKEPGDHYTNSIGMELVKVGSYWAGKYEVTQKEYQKVTGSNPSAFGGGDRPVDSVTYDEAVNFCARLTAQEHDEKTNALPSEYYYTLPTEDEWQQLAAGTSLNDSVTSMNGNRRQGTEPVGSLKPNALGLYDTRGNVMEYCLGDTSRPYRVLRGGSWQDWIEINLRPEFRIYAPIGDRKNTYGFRVLLKKK